MGLKLLSMSSCPVSLIVEEEPMKLMVNGQPLYKLEPFWVYYNCTEFNVIQILLILNAWTNWIGISFPPTIPTATTRPGRRTECGAKQNYNKVRKWHLPGNWHLPPPAAARHIKVLVEVEARNVRLLSVDFVSVGLHWGHETFHIVPRIYISMFIGYDKMLDLAG